MSANARNDENRDQLPADTGTGTMDPIGPVTLPNRSLVGSRALALLGTASVATLAAGDILGGNPTWTFA